MPRTKALVVQEIEPTPRKIEGTEREDEFISLVVSGMDVHDIAQKMKASDIVVERTFRDASMVAKIKLAVQAKAIMSMPKMLNSAEDDAEDRRAATRNRAREFIRKVAEGEPNVIQQNNQITNWDPSYDEALFEKGRAMFQSLAEIVSESTVAKFIERDQED